MLNETAHSVKVNMFVCFLSISTRGGQKAVYGLDQITHVKIFLVAV